MNSLYTLGVRQTSSIQADLERMKSGESGPSIHGQITASLTALQRTIEDYDSVAKRELIKAKQEKAQMRVQKFRSDHNEMRMQFEQLKNEQAAQQKAELFASSSTTANFSDARRRYATTVEEVAESPFRSSNPEGSYTSMDRESHALREHTFLQESEARIDEFLAQGREVLDNLVDQRNILKGTQRRLMDAANTLGMSRDVIGWIERRSTQDMYIFYAGAAFTFFCFYLIWRYLG